MDVDTIFKTINQNKYLREINTINVNYTNFNNLNKIKLQDLIIKLKTLYESSLKINIINQYNNINDNYIIENKKNIYINEKNNLNLKLSEKKGVIFLVIKIINYLFSISIKNIKEILKIYILLNKIKLMMKII